MRPINTLRCTNDFSRTCQLLIRLLSWFTSGYLTQAKKVSRFSMLGVGYIAGILQTIRGLNV